MKSIVIAAALLFLAGCGVNPSPSSGNTSSSGTTPPPPSTGNSTASWSSNGNPDILPCSASIQQNCLLSYTLIDATTGKTIATIPIDEFQYQIPNAAHDTYSLVVNLQVLPGQLLQSDPVTAVAK